jgi:hypothetical protein
VSSRPKSSISGWLAEAARIYVQRSKAGKDVELYASENVIRAERLLGEMLDGAKKAGQIREGRPGKTVVGADSLTTLEEHNISRDLSSRAQKLFAIPDDEFEQRIEESCYSPLGRIMSSTAIENNVTDRKGYWAHHKRFSRDSAPLPFTNFAFCCPTATYSFSQHPLIGMYLRGGGEFSVRASLAGAALLSRLTILKRPGRRSHPSRRGKIAIARERLIVVAVLLIGGLSGRS